jgi:cytochrome P450
VATVADADGDPFGLLSPAIFRAPHDFYHVLRHADPVHWHPATASWILTAYSDVDSLLKRSDLLSSAERRQAARRRLDPARARAMAPIDAYLRDWVLDMDPPRHAPIRQHLNRWFTAKALERHEQGIRSLAAELADQFVKRGGGDLIALYAHPLPVRIIARMVGVPDDDLPRILDWFARMSRFFERGAADASLLADASAAIQEIDDWLAQLITLRRADPRDDVISDLARLPVPGLSDRGVRSTLLLLLFSGHESSRATISNAILALLGTPSELERLRTQPALLGEAVEDFLRFDGPFMRQDRLAIANFELRGKRIRRGERVVLVLGAANRDPARFHAPDSLILDRPDNHHVAFGHGIHFCLGSRLARMEIAIAVQALLDAAPALELGDRGYRWREHFNNRGLVYLDLRARTEAERRPRPRPV